MSCKKLFTIIQFLYILFIYFIRSVKKKRENYHQICLSYFLIYSSCLSIQLLVKLDHLCSVYTLKMLKNFLQCVVMHVMLRREEKCSIIVCAYLENSNGFLHPTCRCKEMALVKALTPTLNINNCI